MLEGPLRVGRSALAMAVAPLDTARQDTARTIVDIVAYRGATLLASAGLLLIGDVPLHALAPWAIAISAIAIVLSFGVGERYRRALYDAGVYVNVAIHPAVPPGGALLRTSVMATHDRAVLDRALDAFKNVKRSFESEHGPLPESRA